MTPKSIASAASKPLNLTSSVRLSYQRDGSSLPFASPVSLRLPQFRLSASLWPQMPAFASKAASTVGDVRPASSDFLSPTPPSLDAWCRDPLDDAVWLDPALRDWTTTTFVRLYVLGCDGLFKLHKVLGTSLFKVGLTEQRAGSRVREISRGAYASHYLSPQGWISTDGFDAWRPKTPLIARFPSPASPVVVMSDCIGVHLPGSISFQDFDRALAQQLAPVSVDRWCRRPEVRADFTRRQIDPGLGLRGTLATESGISRIEEAHEDRKSVV